MRQGILLCVDYHDENCVIRRRDLARGTEEVLSVPTTAGDLLEVVADARRRAGPRGRVVWLQESTTGWARVVELLGKKAEFLLANMLQMPLPPKGRRKKTDKVDTARLQREYLNGELPLAHQPPVWWRQVRRVVVCRENLVNRRTALRNGINRHLAHETWEDRVGLWSVKGRKRLRSIVAKLPARDGLVMTTKVDELERLQTQLTAVEAELHAIYRESADAQRLDVVRGIGVVSAVPVPSVTCRRPGPMHRGVRRRSAARRAVTDCVRCVQAQLRVETFNTFNHTQWAGVNAGISVPNPSSPVTTSSQGSTGQVSSTRDPRNIQFGLKLIF